MPAAHQPPHHRQHRGHAGHVRSLQRWQRWGLYGTVAALLASGLLWLALHYSMGAGRADQLPHPLEAWAMRLHGLATFGALFMLGVVAGVHLPRGFRMTARRRWAHQRPLGLMLCVLAVLLAASGHALVYLVPERWHEAVGWGHALLGLLLAGTLALHARRG